MGMKFIQDKELGTTTAIMEGCKYDAMQKFWKLMAHSKKGKVVDVLLDSDAFGLQDTYTATVKLHPDDVWDDKIGIAEARKKVLKKYNKAFNKAMVNMLDSVFYGCDEVIKYLVDKRHVPLG